MRAGVDALAYSRTRAEWRHSSAHRLFSDFLPLAACAHLPAFHQPVINRSEREEHVMRRRIACLAGQWYNFRYGFHSSIKKWLLVICTVVYWGPSSCWSEGSAFVTLLHSESESVLQQCCPSPAAQALASPCQKEAPLLYTLGLNLQGNNINDAGAQAFAGLNEAPLLHTLSLDLRGNNIKVAGIQALSTLKEASSLHTTLANTGCLGRVAWAMEN